ncbi:MAG: hypothetical protein QOG53_1560 [Frankiales bacterium]|nr:hypothetical protein [Frankiales bacterium]
MRPDVPANETPVPKPTEAPNDTLKQELDPPDEATDSSVVQDASAPDILDLRAVERDAAAAERDRAAAQREKVIGAAVGGDNASLERLFAERDRAAAALDRYEAALDRHRAADYLRHVYRDRLTGALQRDAGQDRLAAELDRCRRRGEALVIAFIDVDHLKVVNDKRGHAAGDELLQAVGAALLSGLRSYDIVVRYGGDEFVCAMADARREEAELRLSEVQKVLESVIPGASISAGIAVIDDEESLDDAIGRADRDLYRGRADRAGRATAGR